jgi:hypothetical protein
MWPLSVCAATAWRILSGAQRTLVHFDLAHDHFRKSSPIFGLMRSITGSPEFVREKWKPVFPEKQDHQSLSAKSGDWFSRKDKRKPKAWSGEEIIGMETA